MLADQDVDLGPSRTLTLQKLTLPKLTLTWFIINLFGIFFLRILWFKNETITVKFEIIPMEGIVLWISIIVKDIPPISSSVDDVVLVVILSETVTSIKTSIIKLSNYMYSQSPALRHQTGMLLRQKSSHVTWTEAALLLKIWRNSFCFWIRL